MANGLPRQHENDKDKAANRFQPGSTNRGNVLCPLFFGPPNKLVDAGEVVLLRLCHVVAPLVGKQLLANRLTDGRVLCM